MYVLERILVSGLTIGIVLLVIRFWPGHPFAAACP